MRRCSTHIPWPPARTVQLDQLMTTRSQPPRAPAALLAAAAEGHDGPCDSCLAGQYTVQVQLNAPTAQRARAIMTNSLLPLVQDVSRPYASGLVDHATDAPLVANPVARGQSVEACDLAPAWVVRERGIIGLLLLPWRHR